MRNKNTITSEKLKGFFLGYKSLYILTYNLKYRIFIFKVFNKYKTLNGKSYNSLEQAIKENEIKIFYKIIFDLFCFSDKSKCLIPALSVEGEELYTLVKKMYERMT